MKVWRMEAGRLMSGENVTDGRVTLNGLMTHPIEEADLLGTLVMVHSVLTCEENAVELNRTINEMRSLLDPQWQVLKAFGDLYLELVGETERRQFLSKELLRAEREAARLRLPLWFWRPEPGVELKVQLFRRACFLLHEQRANLDDTFDLLSEFCDQYARPESPFSDEQLAGVIEYALRKGGPS